MTGGQSLSLRLLAGWLAFLFFTLPIAAFGLQFLFERSINRGVITELSSDLQLISDSLEIDALGAANLVDVPAHPQFLPAYGHRYWQITENGKLVLRSPSLWAETLHGEAGAKLGEISETRLQGPNDQSLLGLTRFVKARGSDQRMFEIIVAIDYAEILEARRMFANDVWIGVGALFLLIIVAAAVQGYAVLLPLKALRNSLLAVKNGEASRIEGSFPAEVRPLISETNELLAARDSALAAARSHAADLAHGLKTPLAVMAALSRQWRREGSVKRAEEFERQLELMRWNVERELTLSRPRSADARAAPRIDAGTEVCQIVNALKKLPKSNELLWRVRVKPTLPITIDRADFTDIMGNVLDNAQKWARAEVLVEASQVENSILLTVDDDGPGVKEEQIERIVQRGERADTSVPGTGLGLAIASDLVFMYGGQLQLSRSSLGGLRASIRLNAGA